MKRKISIIGKSGSLASSLRAELSTTNQVTCYGKEQINMLIPESISSNIDNIKNSNTIIICSGVFTGNVREMLDINSSGPIQILSELQKVKSKAHVIIIGSHASTWTSWPDMDIQRLTYNVAKKTILEFAIGLEHSEASDLTLTVYNASRFNSAMNSGGMPIQQVVNNVSWIIDHENPPLVFENSKSK